MDAYERRAIVLPSRANDASRLLYFVVVTSSCAFLEAPVNPVWFLMASMRRVISVAIERPATLRS